MTDKKKGQAMANVSVIGAGSWGTALALLLCKNGHDVTVWSYKEEEVRTLSEKREHVSKLPGVKIPNEIFFTADLKEAVEGKDVVVLAVPSIHVRNTAKKMNAYVKGGQILVDVAKGIEEGTNKTLAEVIEEELPNPVVILSGPSHAEEVAFGIPTTVLTTSHNMKYAEEVQYESEEFYFDRILEEEVYQHLMNAISDLPEQCRKVFLLVLENKSNQEIANMLSVGIETVKSHKKAGKKILYERLKDMVPAVALTFLLSI